MVSMDPSIWVAALLTLFTFSYYATDKINIFYRFAQATVVGVALTFITVIVIGQNLQGFALVKIAAGNWTYIIPIMIGLLIYTRFIKGYAYLSRIPLAIIVATGLGVGARTTLETNVLKLSYQAAKLPVIGVDPFTAITNIIYLIGMISSIVYFFFTLNPTTQKRINNLSLLGRYFILLTLGVGFGSTLIGRLSLLIGRLQFLLFEWLQIA